ncbi:glycosyltransferase family 4 protein [Coleofasciculus sp. FACHB-64]|uniref:glycosyltransferase family 4 protein n=1 Tax=Cyanophyceae TaxID=3028117 RepID=UPI001688CA07|nr:MULTISPECIES: glycosyltransferase family 4 protein [unclassified Coleofasciculus]MBD1840605.1 glycosyltransferase family 4 protein [Coleofasciculus sp. FACHB-501]MBD2044271.1 glycosyltransferase family 4 protein [Coleofasciculus sp. FACHB-64]
MHIAWLGKKSPFCGNVTYSREVTNALLDQGHRVSFLHFAQDEESDLQAWPGCEEVSLPFLYKSQVYTIPTLRSRKVLTQSLEELKPDLVHASLTLSPLDFLLPEICEELNLPLVSTFHTPFDGKRRNLKSGTQLLTYQLYAPFLAYYDRTIIFSQVQRDLLARLGVAASKVAVIPNGVDVQKYCPGPSNIKSELNAKRLFVYQGRIATEKNVEAMLRAWKESEMGPECKLLIVGDGPMKPSLEPFYDSEYGIIWWGTEPDEQRRIEILRGADVFILPSLVEGLSLSLLEAMACGVACVATDAGADGEVLEGNPLEGDAGIILRTQGVAGQLQTLLPVLRGNPEFTQRLGQKAIARVLERYTLSRNIEQLVKLYTELLQERRVQLSDWRYPGRTKIS